MSRTESRGAAVPVGGGGVDWETGFSGLGVHCRKETESGCSQQQEGVLPPPPALGGVWSVEDKGVQEGQVWGQWYLQGGAHVEQEEAQSL